MDSVLNRSICRESVVLRVCFINMGAIHYALLGYNLAEFYVYSDPLSGILLLFTLKR